MEEIVIRQDEYDLILLTNDIEDKNICRDIKEDCENEEEIKHILMVPSRFYDGFLNIDGNHRSISLGQLGKEINGYIVNSNQDRKIIEQLQYKGILAQGGECLENFLKGNINLEELIQLTEEAHEEEMCHQSLSDYLEAN